VEASPSRSDVAGSKEAGSKNEASKSKASSLPVKVHRRVEVGEGGGGLVLLVQPCRRSFLEAPAFYVAKMHCSMLSTHSPQALIKPFLHKYRVLDSIHHTPRCTRAMSAETRQGQPLRIPSDVPS